MLNWTEYLNTKVCTDSYLVSQNQCAKALTTQRNIISQLITKLGPTSIACLGSGYLNDLPVNLIYSPENKVTLIDWIAGISQVGTANQIIHRHNTEYHCLFCDKSIGSKYCKNYSDEKLSEGVCASFIPNEKPVLSCKNYQPGVEPRFLQCDITAGYSVNFSQSVEKRIKTWKTPKDAFIKAIKTCKQIETKNTPVPVQDDSMDLVTSSMVLSQFDNEPYSYFSQLLEKYYGRDQILKHESTLKPLMEELRTKLFVEQVKRHVQEMFRMVKKDGRARVYLSVELFRSNTNDGLFFMVQDIQKAMDFVAHHFLFDMNLISNNHILHCVPIDNGISVIQNYVLVPRAH